MADAGFFKGTSADQDRRFSDKELKLLKTMKFPPEFDKKVDMRKVNMSVIRSWVVNKIGELIGMEDEVLVEYAMGMLENDSDPIPDPRKMQINLTGFLTKDTPEFMTSLWKLLIEAQESAAGVPQSMVEAKKQEMRNAKASDTRAIEERDRRARLDEIRASEREARESGRGGRGRGRGRGGGGGRGRGGGPMESNRPRDGGWGSRGGRPPRPRSISRSPLPRRRSPSRSLRSSTSRSPTPRRRSRSPPRRERSISRSPPRRRDRSPPSRSPPRRRMRSPSYSRRRDSRGSPPRRRRYSPSVSRSRSPPYRGYGRRRSPSRSRSPPRRRRRISYSRSRSRSPPRKRDFDRRRGGRSTSRSSNRSKTLSDAPARGAPAQGSSSRRDKDGDVEMDVNRDKGKGPELKIRGQAAAERQKNQAEDEAQDEHMPSPLERRESELKEQALRNKVVRTRKNSAAPTSSSS